MEVLLLKEAHHHHHISAVDETTFCTNVLRDWQAAGGIQPVMTWQTQLPLGIRVRTSIPGP